MRTYNAARCAVDPKKASGTDESLGQVGSRLENRDPPPPGGTGVPKNRGPRPPLFSGSPGNRDPRPPASSGLVALKSGPGNCPP
jgi:hypothetical protein